MLSLSTAWHPRRTKKLAKVFAAGRRIGFRAFELGVSSVPLDLRAVVQAVERDGLVISSVHAVCGEREAPDENRRGDWIGEVDEDRRRAGVQMARETIDVARRVGASAVVLHGGVVPIPDGRLIEYELHRLVERGAGPDERRPLLDRLAAQRRSLAPASLRALEESLKELCDSTPDLLLGLENRYYAHELPAGDEFEHLFDAVGAPNLRYWHDVGHAEVLDRIGFFPHLELLRRYGDRLAGMHLHDIRGFDDHRPPGEGRFNFAALADFLRPDVLRVMEVSARHSAKSVRRGREHLKEMYGIA